MQTMLPMVQPEEGLESRSITWAAWLPIPGSGPIQPRTRGNPSLYPLLIA